MSTLLCASCGHSFPDTLLTPASFSDRVSRYLSQTSQLVRDTQGKTSADNHRLVQIRQLLQQLCGAVEEELQALQGRQKDGRGSRGTPAAQNSSAQKPDADGLTLARMTSRDATSAAAATNATLGSTTLTFFRQQPPLMPASATVAPLKMFDGAVPSYQLKRMVSAFDLVSATLYSILESLAVQCRASVALLWLRPRQNASSDLVAPFVVGRELASLAHSAPYRTPEASVPCVVCQTGVALNMIPAPHLASTTAQGLTTDLSLTELMEQTNAAQLLVPVHDRYAERTVVAGASPPSTSAAATMTASRTSATTPANFASVMAVVHLIGSPLHPVPFHRHNEEATAQTAVLLSYILSAHYDAMMTEWANRFYVPTTLHATARYAASLDMRPEDKVMDDFAVPPLLIYRTTVSDPREQQSANEARDALKSLQQAALRKSTPLRPMANVRDVCQHATNMEANWVSAMQQTARLEKKVGALEEDLLRRDLGSLQKTMDGKGGSGTDGGPRRSLLSSTSATHLSVSGGIKRAVQQRVKEKPTTAPASAAAADIFKSITSIDVPVELTPAVPYTSDAGATAISSPVTALSGDVLKPEEMEILEAVTLRRLKTLGADTSIFENTS
jgi:hypothetical protein